MYQVALVEVQRENAVLKQRLEDHVRRLDIWAGRAWGLVSLLVGATLSLSAGLVVALVRR